MTFEQVTNSLVKDIIVRDNIIRRSRQFTKTNFASLYTELEKTSLTTDTIMCGICGNVYNFKDETTKLCEHQKELQWGH